MKLFLFVAFFIFVSSQIMVDPLGNSIMEQPFLMDNVTIKDPFLKHLLSNPQDVDVPSKKAVKFISKYGISVYAAKKIKKDEVNYINSLFSVTFWNSHSKPRKNFEFSHFY
jgi:hypothetical protein